MDPKIVKPQILHLRAADPRGLSKVPFITGAMRSQPNHSSSSHALSNIPSLCKHLPHSYQNLSRSENICSQTQRDFKCVSISESKSHFQNVRFCHYFTGSTLSNTSYDDTSTNTSTCPYTFLTTTVVLELCSVSCNSYDHVNSRNMFQCTHSSQFKMRCKSTEKPSKFLSREPSEKVTT